MTRRRFIQKIAMGAWAAMAAGTLPLPVREALAAEGESGLHYRPLDGRSLREIAFSKAHHGPDRFLNPVGLSRKGRFLELFRWKLLSANRFAPDLDRQPISPVSIDWQRVGQTGDVSITFLKHASVLVRDADRTLLIDPVFSEIFWFIKDFSPLAFDPGLIPAPDHVLITHGHYDHLDTASLGQLNPDTHVISPLGYDDVFRDLKMARRTRLDWYESFHDGDRKITLVPANHWTMRNPVVGPNRSLWGGYMIETAGGPTIYVSSDSAYFDGFGELGQEWDIDLAVINLGAYEPRWFMAQSHMNPEETVRSFRELNARKLMIVHWGTFRLGDEPVHFPPAAIRREMEKAGMLDRLVEIRHGETYRVA